MAEQHLREAYEAYHAMGERGFSSTITGSPGEALLSDPGDKRPEMGYLRAATRLTDADADRAESAGTLTSWNAGRAA